MQNCEGIRPALAGEALIQYERMFIGQALHDEQLAANQAGRKRRRNAPEPALLLTGTPRGSFGLEFVPQLREDDSLLAVHAKSLAAVADVLAQVVECSETSLNQVMNRVPPRVIQPLKQFLKVLALYEAELRLAFPDRPSRILSAERIKLATDRLEREVEQKPVTIEGIFRGATLDSGHFDLRTVARGLIKGTVADQLTEEELAQLERLTNTKCLAELEETIVRPVAGPPITSYVLLSAREIESSS